MERIRVDDMRQREATAEAAKRQRELDDRCQREAATEAAKRQKEANDMRQRAIEDAQRENTRLRRKREDE